MSTTTSTTPNPTTTQSTNPSLTEATTTTTQKSTIIATTKAMASTSKHNHISSKCNNNYLPCLTELQN